MTAKKPLKTFFKAANQILDERRMREMLEKARLDEIERQKILEKREEARENRELKAEQAKIFKEEFEPVLKKLKALGDGKLLSYSVVDSSLNYNSTYGRLTPMLVFQLKTLEWDQDIQVKLFSKNDAQYSDNGARGFTKTDVEGIAEKLAERALRWAPEEVADLVRKATRTAKPKPKPKKKPAHAPKR